MEQDSNPSGCKMGCGFYANHSYDGMCSKCYKDHIKKQQQTTNEAVNAGRSTPPTGACGTTGASPLIASTPVSAMATPAEVTPAINIPESSNTLHTPEKNPSPIINESSSPSSQVGSLDDSLSESPGKTKKRNRCYTCRKKVGLTGFECRCGGLFCGLHRYSDKHNCTFDYKADGREQIKKANPVIVGEKVKKI